MLTSLRKKVLRTVRQRGVAGLVEVAFRKVRVTVERYGGAQRRSREASLLAEKAFDATYGVETVGVISLAELSIDNANWEHGVRYQPISPGEFREMMGAIGTFVPDCTFVDFGCGKGRALLLASEYPFDRIIGVEFAPALVEIARRNLINYRNPKQVCRNLEVVLGDAAAYSVPDSPVALFFYNPFDEEIMRRVVGNIRESLERTPRQLAVIYNTPVHDHLWTGIPRLSKVASARDYSIYKTQ